MISSFIICTYHFSEMNTDNHCFDTLNINYFKDCTGCSYIGEDRGREIGICKIINVVMILFIKFS